MAVVIDFDLQLFNIGQILGTVGNIVAPGIGGAIGSGLGDLLGGSSGAQTGGQIGSSIGAGIQSQALSQQELAQIQNFIQQAYTQQGQATQTAQNNDKNVIGSLNNPATSGGYGPALLTAINGASPGAVGTTTPAKQPDFSAPGSMGAAILGTVPPAAQAAAAPSPAGFSPQQQAAINAATTSIGSQAAGMSDYAITSGIINNLQQTGLFTPQELSAASSAFINPNTGKFSNAATPDQVQSWQQQLSSPILGAMGSGASSPAPAPTTIPIGGNTAPPAAPPATTRTPQSAIPLGRPGLALAA